MTQLSFFFFWIVIAHSSFSFIGIWLNLLICSIILRLWCNTFIHLKKSISNLFSSILCSGYVLTFLLIFFWLVKFISDSCLSFTLQIRCVLEYPSIKPNIVKAYDYETRLELMKNVEKVYTFYHSHYLVINNIGNIAIILSMYFFHSC